MIIYNVTLSVQPQIENEFITWLKETHIPEVLATGLFIEGRIFKVIEDPEKRSHNSFAVQYRLKSWKHFEQYNAMHAPGLKKKTQDKYGEKVLSYRTFLEQV